MKLFFISCVIFAMVHAEMDRNIWSQEMGKAVNDCLAAKKIKNDEFEELLAAGDRKGLCVMACANKKMNLFDGRKFNIFGIHTEAKKIFDVLGMEYSDNAKNEITECVTEINKKKEDPCMKQSDLNMCFTAIFMQM